MKKLPIWMTTVTPVSKITAAILFITLPFVGFYLGTALPKPVEPYSKTYTSVSLTSTVKPSVLVTTSPVTNTQNPSESLKNVSNDELGIQFSIPQDWKVSTVKAGSIACSDAKNILKNSSDCKNGLDLNQILIYSDPNNIFKTYNMGHLVEPSPKPSITLYTLITNDSDMFCPISSQCGKITQSSFNILNTSGSLKYEGTNYNGVIEKSLNSGTSLTVPAGSKSIYKGFTVSFNAENSDNLNSIKKILSSFSY